MYRFLFLLVGITSPAWCQPTPTDSIPSGTIPPISNYRSSLLLEGGYAYAATFLPAMRSFFNDHQVKRDKDLDRFAWASLAYRRQRIKVMAQSFLGIDQSILPPDQTNSTTLIAHRQNLSGVTLMLGYDLANTRNQRVYLNVGIGSVRYEYSLFQPTQQVVSFQQILQYAPRASVPSLYLTSGFWDVNLEMTSREKHPTSFHWVSRIGYRRRLQPNTWQSQAYQLVDAPQERISQLYLQIGFCVSRNYKGHRTQ